MLACNNERPWKKLSQRITATGLIICAATVALSAPSASGASADPIALIGETTGASISDARFDVMLWPRDDVDKALGTSEHAVPTHTLPESSVEVDGRDFTVRLGQNDVPAEYVHEDGRVHLNVVILNSRNEIVGDVSSTVTMAADAQTGQVRWLDSAIAPPADNSSATVNDFDSEDSQLQPARVPVVIAQKGSSAHERIRIPDAQTTDTSCCRSGWRYQGTYRDRNSVIGKTYVPSGTNSTAWAYFSSSRTTTLGIAISASGGYGSYSRSGSKTIGNTFSFEWAKSRSPFMEYKANARYGKYRYQHCSTKEGYCYRWGDYSWRPRYFTGGTSSYKSSYQPTWGRSNCESISRGTWKRSSTYGNDFKTQTGVLIKDVIGIDLYVRNNYEYNAYIAYYAVDSRKKLCGSNSVPSRAGSVRMAKTW